VIYTLRFKGNRTALQDRHFEAPDDAGAQAFARAWVERNHMQLVAVTRWLLTLDAPANDLER
jgi:hypothetical protein